MDPLNAYRMLHHQVDEVNPLFAAPVAEYNGAALVEFAGKVPKVYRGQQYTTDGSIYLLLKEAHKPGYLSFVKFPDERTVKLVLEQPGQPERFMSMREVGRLLRMPQLSPGPWEWDEEQGCFDHVG